MAFQDVVLVQFHIFDVVDYLFPHESFDLTEGSLFDVVGVQSKADFEISQVWKFEQIIIEETGVSVAVFAEASYDAKFRMDGC